MESILYQNKASIDFNGFSPVKTLGTRHPENMAWIPTEYDHQKHEVNKEKYLALQYEADQLKKDDSNE